MLDGVGGRGRTAPIPPPSSRQTSMEVSRSSVVSSQVIPGRQGTLHLIPILVSSESSKGQKRELKRISLEAWTQTTSPPTFEGLVQTFAEAN